MPDLGLTHVALPCTDLERSLSFYSRYGGMQVVHRRVEPEGGVAWIGDGTRPFVIVLLQCAQVGSPLRPQGHLGVACISRDRVDQLCEQARAEGCLLSGPTDSGPPIGYWAYLQDPDGHTLEIAHGQEVSATVAQSLGDPNL